MVLSTAVYMWYVGGRVMAIHQGWARAAATDDYISSGGAQNTPEVPQTIRLHDQDNILQLAPQIEAAVRRESSLQRLEALTLAVFVPPWQRPGRGLSPRGHILYDCRHIHIFCYFLLHIYT